MLILTVRTDKPEAELGLFENEKQLSYEKWLAHRELAETIHAQIQDLLVTNGKDIPEVQGIVIFRGPGSFTGLRIGVSVANALANSLQIPIVSTKGNDWVVTGIAKLANGINERIVVPDYGSEPHITKPKH
ncbi:MAG TPA: tRNA (adenosine(37)-N6)-threonylcarbamoyltransferase complex dimerization subunit type 1 TsaB [Candidatus Saccharimonadales bacterium]|nr:tRNA (adenosine(37)-N6)-threonylcarbamoyltransferase complex dimerization subunit type 1 TsaB [Candidatus Saccharimonadales bacterium]